ncbi:MAG: hypothetical protein JO276_05900 [Sphingomonadaceae bacterium]|nr:hypothetical protein [Sphingomonadaceae bacterium]
MGPLVYVIAIMGCGEGDQACREVQVAEPRFATQQACAAATADVLARYTDLSFPSVVAQCRRDGPRPAVLRGNEVLLPQPALTRPIHYAAAGRVRG